MSFICAGDVGPVLGDADAGDGGVDGLGRAAVGVAGLGIEGLELARPAAHEQQDAGHALRAQLVGVQRHGVLPAEDASAGGAGGDVAQERAPADDAVAVGLHVHEGLQGHRISPLPVSARGLRLVTER